MEIIVKNWPTEAKRMAADIREWLETARPGAAVVDGDEPIEPFAYAGLVITVSTEDTRTPEDIAGGAI